MLNVFILSADRAPLKKSAPMKNKIGVVHISEIIAAHGIIIAFPGSIVGRRS
jgi:hypothetical protein